MTEGLSGLGIVVIGRNEGVRLHRCLDSLGSSSVPIVYVDSASSDDSVDEARRRGIDAIELGRDRPLNAARARNAGFAFLREARPELEFVQFIDGDCQLGGEWLPAGVAAMRDDAELAVVCGRLRELNREANVYHRLCDMEWNAPIGEVEQCGGIALMRASALAAVGGFDEQLIAGEEPELCWRLRRDGWRIRRLNTEMARHDAAMRRFGQWWRRAMRSGFVLAQGLSMYGRDYTRARGVRSCIAWSVVWPMLGLLFAGLCWWQWGGLGVLVAAAVIASGYAALFARILLRRSAHGDASRGDAAWYALFCVIGKFAEFAGCVRFWVSAWRGKQAEIIEHRGPG